MAHQARCNRVHSAVTHQVNVIEAEKVNVHAAFLKFASGQLPFLGSMVGKPAEDIKEAVTGELKNYFRPEFLNRIDETVVFHALDAKNIESIARIQLKVLIERLQKMELTMEVSEAAIAELAKVGFDPVFGARPLKRAIQQRIENPLSKLLLCM